MFTAGLPAVNNGISKVKTYLYFIFKPKKKGEGDKL
jgi:hypothetical protein